MVFNKIGTGNHRASKEKESKANGKRNVSVFDSTK